MRAVRYLQRLVTGPTQWSGYRTAPRWVKFCVAWTVVTALMFAVETVDKVAAAPLSSPRGCRLDNPDRPCWANPSQMGYWFAHDHDHGFVQLRSSFHFPPQFIHAWQRAHARWCDIHQCDQRPTARDCFSWCQYRNSLDQEGCANSTGWSLLQWECESGYRQHGPLRMGFSHTEKVVITCGGAAAIGFAVTRSLIGVIGGGAPCMWGKFIDEF